MENMVEAREAVAFANALATPRELAELLIRPLGYRWVHVCEVAAKAERYGLVLADASDRADLVSAAWLHDVGYAGIAKRCGFHPADGARFLEPYTSRRVCTLVAMHSGAAYEARASGLQTALAGYSRERSRVADLLDYCDLTTGPRGQTLSVERRVDDVLSRYGEDHVVSVSLRAALPDLRKAIRRAQLILVLAGWDPSTLP
jgi:HD superfamily phosphodiesterase